MSNEILNCAVIGLGIGEQHAKALLSHPRAKLTSICDLDDKKVTDFLGQYAVDTCSVKTFPEILLDQSIDLVSIASFDHMHFEQVIAALQHGKHVFVEKPLCQTREQLEEIYNLWKASGLALSSNLILRKAPLFIGLRKMITSGELGEIYAVDMDYLYGRIHKITEGWRGEINNYSVMAGGGIHLVDLMILFLDQKPIQVQSCVNKITTRDTAFLYHDYHAATYYFAGGAIGRITANFGCVHKHQHVLRIFGTKATVLYDDMGARIYRTRDEAPVAKKLN